MSTPSNNKIDIGGAEKSINYYSVKFLCPAALRFEKKNEIFKFAKIEICGKMWSAKT